MDITIYSFTQQASHLALTLKHKLKQNYSVPILSYTTRSCATSTEFAILSDGLTQTVSRHFHKDNVLIFICACGIAVRAIAPFIENKAKDPCVIVIDEKGQYAISLLSGHLGGGNEYTLEIAQLLGAMPVISTATDLNGLFAVDVFAKKNKLLITDMEAAKKISAALLSNRTVVLSVSDPLCIQGKIPSELTVCDDISTFPADAIGLVISPFLRPSPFSSTLHLIPRQTVLGIGCKRDTDSSKLANFVSDTLRTHQISPDSVAAITSIDLKKDETALNDLAFNYGCPFLTYDALTLKQVPGTFTASSFVAGITGVDNVCERSSLCFSKADHLFLAKTAHDGMTIAISFLPTALHF